MTLIAFVGSVFSPYYAWSGRDDPLDHCALNVAVYGAGGRRWAMTERRRAAVTREATVLSIGPSRLTWEGGALTITFDEVTSPRPSRLRGVVRLFPQATNEQVFSLDAARRHRWRPIAPRARVEVSLDNPGCAWRGDGYFDTNVGDEPLEDAFVGWDWSRAHLPEDTLLFYDVTRRGGETASLALGFDRHGAPTEVESPAPVRLPSTAWGIPRLVRGDADGGVSLRRTLEDTPFYARSALSGRFAGRPAEMIHESLSLNRLRSPIVRAMLPFRMPRTLW